MEFETQEFIGLTQVVPPKLQQAHGDNEYNFGKEGPSDRFLELHQRYGGVDIRQQPVARVEEKRQNMPQKNYPRRKKQYIWVLTLFLVYSLSFGLAIPALPGLVLYLTYNNSPLSSIYFGAATFMRYCLEFVAAPVMGTVADIRGRKFVMQFSFFVCFLELGLLSFVPSIPMLFVARAISGIGDMGASITYTMITDISTYNGDKVSEKYSLVGAMLGLAFIIGPLVGGMLCSTSIQLCLFVASVIAFIGFVSACFLIEETLHFSDMAGMDISQHGQDLGISASSMRISVLRNAFEQTAESIKLHFSNSTMRNLTIPYILCTFAGGYIFTWYIYMNYEFSATPAEIGLFLSFHGVVSAIVQGLVIPRIVPTIFGDQDAAQYGLIVSAIHVFCFSFCSYQWNLYILTLAFCLGSMYFPAMKAMIVEEGLKSEGSQFVQGNLQGVMNSMSTITMAVGALVFSALFSIGLTVHERPLPYLPFILSSILYMISFFCLRYVLSYKWFQLSKSDFTKDADSESVSISIQASSGFGKLMSMFAQSGADERMKDDGGISRNTQFEYNGIASDSMDTDSDYIDVSEVEFVRNPSNGGRITPSPVVAHSNSEGIYSGTKVIPYQYSPPS